MRRLSRIEALLLATLLPIWLAALALHVVEVARGGLEWVGVYVRPASDPGGFPTVSGLWPDPVAQQSDVVAGDELFAVGGADLAGAGPFSFFATAQGERAHARADGTSPGVDVRLSRRGAERTATLPFVPVRFPWRMLPLTIGFAVAGTLVLTRRPGVPVSRAFFVAAIMFGLHWTWFFGTSAAVTWAWTAVFLVASTLMFPMSLITATLFPSEVAAARAPRWPWLFAVTGPIVLGPTFGAPLPASLGLVGLYVLNLAFVATLLAVLTRNYRRAGAAGRRQLKWVVYGFYAGLAPVVAADLVTLARPQLWWLHDLAAVAEILLPACIVIAIVRDKLWDIDQLITRTVAYSILSAIGLWLVLGVAAPAAEAASAYVGLDQRVGWSAFSAVVALSLAFANRFLRPRIDRLFFRERYALRAGVEDMLSELPAIDDAQSLIEVLGKRLTSLFRPTSCAIFVPRGDGLALAFHEGAVRGDGDLVLPHDSALVDAVVQASSPLDVAEWRPRHEESLHDSDRRLLDDYRPSVILPLRVGDEIEAVVSMGAKRAGDDYGPGDLALLAAVVERMAKELDRIDRARRTATGPQLIPRKYQMIGPIGRGGMGSVFRVRHVLLDEVYALKILSESLAGDPDAVQRFHREARVMSQLKHRNVVRVYDVDQEGSVHFFVMECIDGTALNRLLYERGPLPLREAIALGRQIASALAYAHGRRPAVVHRDVKPANILVEKATGRAVLTDFGIAKLEDSSLAAITRTGAFIGTARYSAPEQLRGDKAVDARADVYALGLVLFEMSTGRPPFAGLEDHEILTRLLHAPGESALATSEVQGLPLARVILRATQRAADARYAGMVDLLADLDAAAREHGLDGAARERIASAADATPGAAGEPRPSLAANGHDPAVDDDADRPLADAPASLEAPTSFADAPTSLGDAPTSVDQPDGPRLRGRSDDEVPR